jgi:hypothetical protein
MFDVHFFQSFLGKNNLAVNPLILYLFPAKFCYIKPERNLSADTTCILFINLSVPLF